MTGIVTTIVSEKMHTTADGKPRGSVAVSGLSYSHEKSDPPALSLVSLDAAPGEVVGIVGVNASGKSTLLHLLAGLYVPGEGRVRIGDAESSPDADADPDAVRRKTALVLQDADVQIIGSTVEEDLFLGLDKQRAVVRDTAVALAKRFCLDAVLDKPVHTISHGQRRKLCLATALLRSPEVLLLDEPFCGLDYPAILEMRDILQENAASGLTQIVATHDIEPLADIADKWVVLSKGRVVASGTAEDVFDSLAEHGVRPPCSWTNGRTLNPW